MFPAGFHSTFPLRDRPQNQAVERATTGIGTTTTTTNNNNKMLNYQRFESTASSQLEIMYNIQTQKQMTIKRSLMKKMQTKQRTL
jgi:hypothetical protein